MLQLDLRRSDSLKLRQSKFPGGFEKASRLHRPVKRALLDVTETLRFIFCADENHHLIGDLARFYLRLAGNREATQIFLEFGFAKFRIYDFKPRVFFEFERPWAIGVYFQAFGGDCLEIKS